VTAPCPLTASQLRLVEQLATGASDRLIAARLGRTEMGVKWAVREARQRAGARNRVHLAALAITHGWIE
jgi:DNA-binding CsgD family transcriptional regulator